MQNFEFLFYFSYMAHQKSIKLYYFLTFLVNILAFAFHFVNTTATTTATTSLLLILLIILLLLLLLELLSILL